MKSLFVALLLLVLASSVSAQSKQCRALILEGGGPRNAYTAGVLKAVVELLPKDEYRYDVVSGVSMAAINTFIMGMHAPGDEQAAVKEILNFWENLDEDKVYQSWFLGFLQGLLTKSGLYDLEPFTDTVKDLTDSYKHGFLRKILITVTDLNSGTGAVADETSSLKNFATYLKASAATPGFFPPVVVNNTTLCEGTVVCTANIPDAIETCRLMVDRDEDIILDLVMVQEGNSPSHLIVKSLEKNCSDYTALDMIMRYLEISGYVTSMHALDDIVDNYPKVRRRHIFYPKAELPTNTISVTFDNEQLREMIAQGEKEAKETIKAGEVGPEAWEHVRRELKTKTQ